MSEEKKFSIEEAFASIDEKLREMERDDVTLERSFALYKEGIELVESCEKEIDTVEKKVLELSGNGEVNEFS